MSEQGVPITGEYRPERDIALVQILWAIDALYQTTTTEHWQRMKPLIQERVEHPSGKKMWETP